MLKKVLPLAILSLGMSVVLYNCAPKVYRSTPATPQPAPQRPTPPPVVQESKPAPKPAPPKVLPANVLTNAEASQGWKLLFDGTSSDGWHAYGSKTIGTAWKISDGTIYFDAENNGQPKTGGDIVTDNEYGNFELQLDWKISKGGNSGVCIYIHEDRSKYQWMWNTAPEIQIVDDEGHPDGKIYKHQAGDLYDLIPAKVKAANAPMEWNHYLIRCINGKLDIYLNQQHVVSTQLWTDEWRALIAGSKFKSMPNFGTYKTGRIGLQDHGNNVWFRNIKVRKL